MASCMPFFPFAFVFFFVFHTSNEPIAPLPDLASSTPSLLPLSRNLLAAQAVNLRITLMSDLPVVRPEELLHELLVIGQGDRRTHALKVLATTTQAIGNFLNGHR